MFKIVRAGTREADSAIERITGRMAAMEGPGNLESRRRTREVFGRALSPAEVVERIVSDVRSRGDRALFDYARRLDGATITSRNVRVSRREIAGAHRKIDRKLLSSIRKAAANIRRYQKRLLPRDVPLQGAGGLRVGARCMPIGRVACMIPAGEAPLFSCVLMNAIPAQVAGVPEVVLATASGADGKVHPAILAAACEIGVTEIYRVGGAHAVVALAFGTESVPRVDKIVGPGNLFVALAKRAVYGYVDIDMVAGPSEVLVLADASADADYVAADLLAQAEHDTMASAILVTTSQAFARRVRSAVEARLRELPRGRVAAESILRQGLAIVARNIKEAVGLANAIAPEHIELLVKTPLKVLKDIRHAGAVFIGPHTPEPVGDYIAGPSHTLPTGGTARYFSGLSAADFVRRSSVISCTPQGLKRLRADIVRMAEAEQLDAHAQSIEARFPNGPRSRVRGPGSSEPCT